MSTFASDPSLPSLPVPELTATCAAIPELVAPLVDGPTLAATRAVLEDFARPGGPGERLQNCLLDRAVALPGNDSWLRPLWDDMYLESRDPLPLNINYAFRFDEKRWGGEAALPRLARALALAAAAIGSGSLEAERTKSGPLSMDQAGSCFYTRIAGKNADSLSRVPLGPAAHIAVVCRGHWFALPLIKGDGSLAAEKTLEKAFRAIRRQAADLPAARAVAALTAAPRDEAAELRSLLLAETQNRLSLAALEGALFAVCLDEPPKSREAAARALLGGDAACRWFDKSLQIIAAENGFLGANFEHAGCDAAIWHYLLARADAMLAAGITAPESPDQDGCGHALLPWTVPDELDKRLSAIRDDFAARMADMDLACRDFPEFSRESLKALSTSPDAFLQTCFQVAQHQVFGKLRSSYEAISTRAFAGGRTECARGSSGEALAFALALQKQSPADKRHELYRQTERIHKSRLQRCQRGLGVERHMYGLEAMFRLYGQALGIEPAPAVFTDKGWLTLKHNALSTSGMGAAFISAFAFGPVCDDGFGIGYAPNAESTSLTVTCKKSGGLSAERFIAAFAQAAVSTAALLRDKLK